MTTTMNEELARAVREVLGDMPEKKETTTGLHKITVYYDPNDQDDSFKSLRVEGIPSKDDGVETAIASCALLRASARITSGAVDCDEDALYHALGEAGTKYMTKSLLGQMLRKLEGCKL